MANRAQKTLQLYYHLNGINGGGGEGGPEPEIDYFYIENVHNGTNTLTLTSIKKGNTTSDLYASSVEYSTDKTNWTTVNFDTSTPATIPMNSGDKVYFRNDSGKFNYYDSSNSFYTSFKTTEDCSAGGDLRSILNYEDIDNVVLTQGCFYSLFRGFNKLKTSLKLPATTLAPYCYYSMFNGCSSLTEAPQLPATTLATNCYSSMFNGCSSLTEAPQLPATTLAPICYSQMFHGCSSLSVAPQLPATTPARDCYSQMFYGCSSLTEAPQLPATTLASSCYSSMFSGCSSLTEAPQLPATTLAPYCYSQMFDGCSSLSVAPQLPATTPAPACYFRMFYGCTGLTTAPQLPATTLAPNCYFRMFYGCTQLSEVTTYANNISAISCIEGWLYGVSASGTFYNYGTAEYIEGESGIPTGWTEVKPEPEIDYFYIENTYNGTNTLTLRTDKGNTTPSNTYAKSVEYSKDKENWTSITLGTTLGNRPEITMQPSEKVYFRNNTGKFNYYEDNYVERYATCFDTSQSCSAGGDLRSLLNYEDIDNVVLTQGCFYHLFYASSNLTDITNLKLPSTTLSPWCYANLFESCYSLTEVPENLLPATELSNGCYYGIFGYCSSLTKAPNLPATVLTPYCYTYAFEECSSLTEVTTYANDISAISCIEDWLYYVADSGTFYNLGSAEYIEGESGIPTGWNVVTQ